MLRQWNKLVLVANDGHVAYEGPIFDVLSHFSSLGYEVVNDLHVQNPVEFALELLGEEDSSTALIAAWASRSGQPHVSPVSVSDSEIEKGAATPSREEVENNVEESIHVRRALPFHWQLWVLLQRHALYNALMLHGIKGKVLSNVFAGCLYGVIYHNNATKLWDLKVLYDPRTLSLSEWC